MGYSSDVALGEAEDGETEVVLTGALVVGTAIVVVETVVVTVAGVVESIATKVFFLRKESG